ncbi:MAG: ATP synthase F1 subunit epsilon [Planctomycetota bacterium]|nr:ATP synthase F1 subunit epsilon [Planctomycetota bacterium]
MAETAREKIVTVRVISPSREVLVARAESVTFPAFDGSWGVLPGHAPMAGLLGTGIVTLRMPDGATSSVAVRGGFVRVSHGEVVILSPEAAAAGDVSREALAAERAEIAARKPRSPEEMAGKAERLAWLAAREKIAGGS